MRDKILWIDCLPDGGIGWLGPVFDSRRYDMGFALNDELCEAYRGIFREEYTGVILDLNLNVMDSLTRPKKAYPQQIKSLGNKKKFWFPHSPPHKIGILFLESLLQPDKSDIKIEGIPEWVGPERFGVLAHRHTLSGAMEDLERLGITSYRSYSSLGDDFTNANLLLELCDEVVSKARDLDSRITGQ